MRFSTWLSCFAWVQLYQTLTKRTPVSWIKSLFSRMILYVVWNFLFQYLLFVHLALNKPLCVSDTLCVDPSGGRQLHCLLARCSWVWLCQNDQNERWACAFEMYTLQMQPLKVNSINNKTILFCSRQIFQRLPKHPDRWETIICTLLLFSSSSYYYNLVCLMVGFWQNCDFGFKNRTVPSI